MRASSWAAASAIGRTIGILPGAAARKANAYVREAIPTGLGVARNLVAVSAADSVLPIGGRHGMLSEIGLALTRGAQRGHPLIMAPQIQSIGSAAHGFTALATHGKQRESPMGWRRQALYDRPSGLRWDQRAEAGSSALNLGSSALADCVGRTVQAAAPIAQNSAATVVRSGSPTIWWPMDPQVAPAYAHTPTSRTDLATRLFCIGGAWLQASPAST
jgi:hypothetical protein